MVSIEARPITPPDFERNHQNHMRALAFLDLFEHLVGQKPKPYIPDQETLERIDRLAEAANFCLVRRAKIGRFPINEATESDEPAIQMEAADEEKPEEVKLLLTFGGMKTQSLFEATPAKRELFISIQAKGFRNEAYILGLGIEIQSLSGDQNEQVTLAVSRACRNLVGQHGYAVYRYTSKENGVGSKAWNSMILGKPSGEWLDRTGFFPTENELPKQISIAKIVRIITNALRTTIENPEEEFILPSVILNRRTRLRRRLRRLKRVIWRRKTEE